MRPSRPTVYRRWIVACTAGELLGFGGIPVLGAVIVLALTRELDAARQTLYIYGFAVIAGLGEGAVLAGFQLTVLPDLLPGLSRRRWVVATAVAAAFAWACGMLAPTLDELVGLSVRLQVAIWIPASVLILLSIGSAQAWALKGAVERPGRWIVANAAGWLAGLPWTFVLPALLPETAPTYAWVTTFVVAGVLMGLTVGAVTGGFLLKMIPGAAARPP